ncbi:MAG: PQQ-binding-like beta-propeller repeat protein [Fuerstiella sp.]|nr:PQQ-binding-like beta-propeller repeat protein [Fuerstiella sp.]
MCHYSATDIDGDNQTQFEETFHRTWGRPTIHNGLLPIADFSGLVHCLSADNGELFWTYDLFASSWSSPLIADGRVFVGDEDGEVTILNLGKTSKLIGELSCQNSIYSAPVAVGNTLFVATKSKLLAIRQDQPRAPVGKKLNAEADTEAHVEDSESNTSVVPNTP